MSFVCLLPLQVKESGLQCAYQEYRGTNLLIKKVMALPFLLSAEIPGMFARMEEEATTTPMQTVCKVKKISLVGILVSFAPITLNVQRIPSFVCCVTVCELGGVSSNAIV